MKFYSKSTRGFYDPTIHGPLFFKVPDPDWVNPDPEGDPDAQPPLLDVRNAAIPEDAIEIPDELHRKLLDEQAKGAEIKAAPDGTPMAIYVTQTIGGMRDAVLAEARKWRKDILDALTGIGFRALAAGDAATAAYAAQAQQALLDVTKDARILAVTLEQGPEVLRNAVIQVYKERAAATHASVRIAFKEVDL